MRVLKAVLVAPSRYDERGVIVFRIGITHNGSLGAIAGLAEDYNRRHRHQARIDYEVFDEHVRFAVTPALLRQWRDDAARSGERFVLMVCGIQTGTYPRGRDIALMARREGIEVIAGGVHLSGHGPSVEFLVSCGVRVAVGEVEPIWDVIVDDAMRGTLRPLYRLSATEGLRAKAAGSEIFAPDISDAPFPHMPSRYLRYYLNKSHLCIDTSRGCPYLCTFCAVKNVFGRTVRGRDPKVLAEWMIERVERDGVRWFSFTDDNFLRNPRHIELLERLAEARAKGAKFWLSCLLDVESSCYAGDDSPRGERTRAFLKLCQAAGMGHVYMGLESTNDAVLQEMRKGVNRARDEIHGDAEVDPERARRRLVLRYQAAVRAWHSVGASVECGYILGSSADSAGAGVQSARDLLEIGLDMVSFYLLSPLPGAEDYAKAVRDKTLLLTDFNSYFSHLPMIAHPTLSSSQLEDELKSAVRTFYGWRHVLRRVSAGVLGIGRPRVERPILFAKRQLGYKLMILAGMFSYYEGGMFRRGAAWSAPREAITDEQARRHYLGNAAPLASGLSPAILDHGSMESLPILTHNDLGESVRLAS